jgi:hypothetical protein
MMIAITPSLNASNRPLPISPPSLSVNDRLARVVASTKRT